MAFLSRNIPCAVPGGTQQLERLLQDVQRIKQGLPAKVPELLGFQSWGEAMSLSVKPEGEHLRALVSLVQEHGESRMLTALRLCERDETRARIVCLTAHKAKGREWT